MLTRIPDLVIKDDQAVRRLLLAGMALGFAALIAAGIAAVWITGRIQDHTQWVNHTYEVEVAIANAGRANEQAETSRRGYILTSNRSYLHNYELGAALLRERLAALDRLTADNPRQRRNMTALKAVEARLVAAREATNALVVAGRVGEANRRFSSETFAQRMRMVRDIGTRMTAEEHRLLDYRDDQQHRAIRLFYVVVAGAGLMVALVAIASLLTVLRYTRDLGRSRAALEQLNDNLEETVTERTADLTLANEEIQRFAYIVSHDLRSPLVNVMGFTSELDAATQAIAELIDRVEASAPELVGDDARLAAREDLPEAIGFIRTSTQKMDRLINAILKLSREGRRTITAEPIDLAGMADGVGDALKQQMDARGVTYHVERPMPDADERSPGCRADPVQPGGECGQVPAARPAGRDHRARARAAWARHPGGGGQRPRHRSARSSARVRPVPPLGHAGSAR